MADPNPQLDPFLLHPLLDASQLPGRPTCLTLSSDNQFICIGSDSGLINVYTFQSSSTGTDDDRVTGTTRLSFGASTNTNSNTGPTSLPPLRLVTSKRMS